MTAEELRSQIRQAFPSSPFYGLITDCECEECTDIRVRLRHKRWEEISSEFLDFTCSPVLLTPEAFQAFLSAYLMRALDDLSKHSVVAEFTVYGLCPHDPGENDSEAEARQMNWVLPRARMMSPEQILAIRAFLEYVRENSGDAKRLAPFIASALENVWR